MISRLQVQLQVVANGSWLHCVAKIKDTAVLINEALLTKETNRLKYVFFF